MLTRFGISRYHSTTDSDRALILDDSFSWLPCYQCYILYGGYKPHRIAVIIEPQIVTERYILYGGYKPQRIRKAGTPIPFLQKKKSAVAHI